MIWLASSLDNVHQRYTNNNNVTLACYLTKLTNVIGLLNNLVNEGV